MKKKEYKKPIMRVVKLHSFKYMLYSVSGTEGPFKWADTNDDDMTEDL